ncbi:MAG: DUF309 domain-containing protein [Thermoplasmataceae archaeon]
MHRSIFGLKDHEYCKTLRNINGLIIRRTTYGCEIDVLDVDTASSFIESIDKTAILFISTEEELDGWKRNLNEIELFKKAMELFNKERFWEYHELLEYLWKKASGKKKEFIQCLIWFAVSQIKFQMGQAEIGKIVYEKARNSIISLDEKFISIAPSKECTYPISFNDSQINLLLKHKIMKNII